MDIKRTLTPTPGWTKETVTPHPWEVQAPCEAYCPVNLKCANYISLIKEGEFEKAYRVIRQILPFPLTLALICDRPCESQCRRVLTDKPVHIRDLKRFAVVYAYKHNVKYRPSVKVNREERVAIVGAGPAGLSAAYDLAREGFQVTVFESLPVAGGMMAVGCPEFKLPKKILQDEIKNVTALGVEIRLNSRITDIAELFQQGYRAVFIAIGSMHQGQKLPIPGAELEDVFVGISFLCEINLGKQVKVGKRVLVIGGGNTAVDCARAAVRLGANEVHMACLESREKMPGYPWEIVTAEEEGVVIHPSRTFTRILSERGQITGVECLNVRSVEFGEEGKLHIDAAEGSEHLLPADTVIFATGQVPDLKFLSDSGNVRITRQGFLSADPGTLATDMPGVFAGGDAVTNAGSIIQAIANGQRAALSITSYLNGEVPSAETKRKCDEVIEYPAVLPSSEEVLAGSSPVNIGDRVYTTEEAKTEASRCLRCDLVFQTMRGRMDRESVISMEERVEELEKVGMGLDSEVMRRALLGGLKLYGKYRGKKVKNVIQTGCYVWGTPSPLISFVRLLQHFDVPYAFLEFEMCCGFPLFGEAIRRESEEAYRLAGEKAQKYIAMNMEATKAMGGEDIFQMCQWCTYIDYRFLQRGNDIRLHYYADLLVQLVQEFAPQLQFDGTIGYFPGGRHRNALCYLPSIPDLDWPSYRAMLDRIRGLRIIDLPPYCCVTHPDITVKRMETEGLNTLVTPCMTCYGRFMRRMPSSIRVLALSDLLWEALGGKAVV